MRLLNFRLILVIIFMSHAGAQSIGNGSGSGSGGTPCTTGSVKLVDGSDETNGRVEICIDGEFGTVCDDFWSVSDARVVCRQLGLPWEGATQQSFAHFGQGNGEIVLDDVMCDGSESELLDCKYDDSTVDCTHSEDAGVTCAESIDECSDGDIRLVGGSNDNEGRVEVCVFGQWGTVCDDGWNAASAKVACNSLGISGAAKPFSYGAGEGIIQLDDVICVGNEDSLLNCSFTHDHNCAHFEDAGVTCGIAPQCTDNQLQLIGSDDPSQGRVEVCNFELWGTVCDDSWDNIDAAVVCKQLGLEYTGALAYGNAHYGVGDGPIVFDDVACIGNETSLFNCPYNPNHNCVHFEDAGVMCSSANCNDSDIRIVNGFNSNEGRVEVCLNGVWGTVCDDFWSENDAVVVCRQLGLPTNYSFAIGSAYFGPGVGAINLDNVFCTGSETSITDCSYSDSHNCVHSEDASVICADTQPDCVDGEIRLIGGNNATNEGRVEICSNNNWGTICDDQWGNEDAQVVCRQLGLDTEGAIAVGSATFGQGTGDILLDDVKCIGNESDIFACDYTILHNCGHSEDAGVQCLGLGSECSHGDVKLVGGSIYTEGRVEVCIDGYWGTVCDDSWTYQDAQVVCNQLGYPYTGATALSFAHFGVGSGQINMDDVLCNGNETMLLSCLYTEEHNCIHAEDASVRCLAAVCEEESLRLVGGVTETEGRVEICLGGQWGTVCDDEWGVTDARIVCEQLGYPSSGAEAFNLAHFGQGSGPIVLDNVQCEGDELSILDCDYDPDTSDCTHFEDAGIACAESINECSDGDIRLVGGSNDNEGRVEICVFGQWGTVCDDGWNAASAKVACNSLGISGAAKPFSYGAGEGIIQLDDVICVGNEDSLLNCSFTHDHNCAHFEDAGVTCGIAPQCTDNQLQLIGSDDPSQGRVEVCNFELWGTVCDDSWDNIDAAVVCKQLGLEYTGALAYGNAHYGVGDGPIVFDDVACIGNETSLFNCPYNPNHNCVHFEDAGVMCGSANCNDSDIRIVNGFNSNEGRVEVCLNGVWGTVCDDFWSENDAVVVCRQLGLPTNYSFAIGSAYFGPGVGAINLDNVFCTGSETSITDCSYSDSHNCVHSEDASVICADTQPDCVDGEIRLIGGNNATNEGRVEICSNNNWGTICDDQWGNEDAQVVCRQLGLDTEGANAVGGATFGQGTGDILLDDVKCIGNESDIFACDYTILHNCGHSEDAGVQCLGLGSECSHGDVKLVGGSIYTEGRVEVCIDGYWGTVCDDSWTYQDAQVVCNQLGYPYTGATALSFAHFGVGSGQINMDDVLCNGNETMLLSCLYTEEHNCIHAEDASVQCLAAVCEEESLRLVGGLTETEGRVEICLGGQWGTVCDDEWGVTDARIVCEQLGYPSSGAEAFNLAHFGQGSGPIVLDNLQCEGDELSILDCDYDPDTSDCTHFEDAGIRCVESPNECNDTDVRLVGGNNETEGRIEVCSNGEWGNVCDDFWNQPAAVVVCNQLGYPSGGAQALKQAYFGQGSGKIHLDDVVCLGNETNLFDCDYVQDHNCQHSEDASVICGDSVCNDGEVRLVDGDNMYEGRVELCFNGVWGTVCDDFWGTLDAEVVCNQLGFSKDDALAFSQAYFGVGSGPIQIDDVQCGGGEANLLQCNYQPNHNCFHSEDSGVRCLAISPTSTPTPTGSCGLASFTGCCNASIEEDCFGATGDCYCDESCYLFGNCCEDIIDIGCIAPTTTPYPNIGSCVEQNFNGCCEQMCLGSDGVCYCDQVCYSFGDCCHDIQSIGCYATANSPTSNPSSSSAMSTSSSNFSPSSSSTSVQTSAVPTSSSYSIVQSTVQTTVVVSTETSPNTQTTMQTTPTQTQSSESTVQTTDIATTETTSSVNSNTQSTVQTTPTLSSSNTQSTVQTTGITTTETGTLTTSSSTVVSTAATSIMTSTNSLMPTPSPNVPGQVTNLTITRVTDSEVKITWNSPNDSTGISQYHFLVKQRSGSNVNEELIQAQTNYSQYNVNNLAPYIPYTVVITAISINDDVGPPNSVDFFSKEGKPRMAPTNVALVRVNTTALNISWDPIPIETAQGFILQYLVAYQIQDGTNAQSVLVDSTVNFVIINNLTPGRLYGATVAGITSVGEGPESSITYEEGAGPPQSSGNTAGYIAAGATVITVGVGIILVGLSVVSILVCRRIIKKKYVYDTSSFETDQELLYYSEKNQNRIGNYISGSENKSESEIQSSADWSQSSEVGTYTKLPFEKTNSNLENEMFEL